MSFLFYTFSDFNTIVTITSGCMPERVPAYSQVIVTWHERASLLVLVCYPTVWFCLAPTYRLEGKSGILASACNPAHKVRTCATARSPGGSLPCTIPFPLSG